MYHDDLMAINEAYRIIEKIEIIPKKENIDLAEVNRRVLATDIEVLIDVPPFDRAAMDGYAVNAQDILNATESNPVELKVVDDIGAGTISSKIIKTGEAVKIATGAPMPEGSDTIVMQEFTYQKDEQVYIEKMVRDGQDVSLKGEDLKKGEQILRKGQILNPHLTSLIASAGHQKIEVVKKPNIGVIITGSELIEPSSNLEPGKIINSNKYALKGLIEDCNCNTKIYVVPDDLTKINEIMEYCINNFDVIITTGGTAISEGDMIIDLVSSKGEVLLHGVAMKPGKPFGFGLIDKKPVFMLSGYPVAAAVQFDIFVRGYLYKIQNIDWEIKLIDAVALSDIMSSSDKYNVVRAYYDDGTVEGIRTKAGINRSILKSNCYVISEEGKGKIKKGDTCQVLTYKSLNIC